jgi:hypothetical protein
VPNCAIPKQLGGEPKKHQLPAGTRLSRVHQASWPPTNFNATLADMHWGGGRFDATEEDEYAYLYAGDDDGCAVSESLLRDLPVESSGGRFLPRGAVEGRVLSWLVTSREIVLVRLIDGEDLAAVGQDTWLVQCPSGEYGFTRRWAHAIRRWAPWGEGSVWRSRREPSSMAYVLFRDRLEASGPAVTELTIGNPLSAGRNKLDAGEGELYLKSILSRYNVTLAPANS